MTVASTGGRRRRAILVWMLAALACPALLAGAPVRVPESATLRYQVNGRASGVPYQADAELRWRRQGERYEARWSVGLPLLGSRVERSEGALAASGLAPERYTEKARKERSAYFDLAGARISFSAGTPDAALQPGAQDRLSITMQLAALLAAAPERYPPGAQITTQIAGVHDAEPWTWNVQPDETLRLAGQPPQRAVKLVRQPRKERDSRVELWLARGQQYLPVRLRITLANGDMADQQLTAVER